MKNIFTILRRELSSYFNSAIAYIYLIVFIVINNSLFMTRFFLDGKADMNAYFNILPMVLLVFIPVITMRLWAEDKKENTFELLMTFPMRPIELVLGKFFASLIFYLLSLLSTITIPVILCMSGKPDLGAIAGGYAAALFLGMLFLSIGVFISGLTKEQIVAFVLTALSCFVVFFVGTDFMASFINGWIPGLGVFMKDYLGAASHIISFDKGVIDLKDIIYFTAMSAVFLILNSFLFEGRLRPKAKVVFSSAVLICLAGAVVFNWLVHDLPLGRFDITENKIYTTSLASKKILKDLKMPVSVNLYITPLEKMPIAFKNLEQDITGKPDELRIVSNNKLNFKVFHIEASRLLEQNQNTAGAAQKEDSLEKTLQDKGIVPFQVQSVDKDEVGVKLIYCAAAVAYKEKNEEILPRITPQNIPDLEYILFSRIIKLTSEKKPKVVLFSPLRTKDFDFEMNRLLSSMGQPGAQYEDEYKSIVPLISGNGYDAQRVALSKNDPLPEGVNTLMVINPGNLNERQLYEINKFLYQGGSVLIAAGGFDYSFQNNPSAGLEILPQKLNLSINKLIQKWGIMINEDILMDENNQIIEVTTGQRVGPFALSMPVKVPNQIIIPSENMNKNMPFVNRLPALFYFWGSAIDVADDALRQANLKKTLMFSSGPRSWKFPYGEGGPLKKEALTFPKNGSEGKFTLGLMIEGQFSDTFIEQGMPDWPAKEGSVNQPLQNTSAQAGKKESTMLNPKPGKLIIVGCSKMFYDQLISSSTGNLNFFANIVDGLTLGNNIIQIRSKSYISRDLKKLTDIQKMLYKFIAIFLVPILLAVFAFVRIFIRRKEKQFYLLAVEK